VTEAIHATGQWAVRFILLSLLVTPLRRVAQWPKLINLRRMVGLAAFAYAFAHFCLYVILDQKLALLHVASEIALRFYLTIGFAALLGLGALAATSTDAMIKRLGAARWNQLHKLVYLIAALAIFHFYLQSKVDVSEPVLMMGLYFILMIYRALQKRGWPAWSVAVGAAAAAPLATAFLEATWYAVVRHIDFWRVLGENIDFDNDFRPAIYVAATGLALVVVQFARNWKAVGFPALFSGAK
jgi:sulfoxide reductase heme-binding subunit YedZ